LWPLLEQLALASLTVEEKDQFVQNVATQQHLSALVIAHHNHSWKKQRANVQIYFVQVNFTGFAQETVENGVSHVYGLDLLKIAAGNERSIRPRIH